MSLSVFSGLAVPLHLAISNEDAAMVEVLLLNKCNTEHRDLDYDSPLISACHSGHSEVVSHLITSGCDVNALGYNGNTALHHAVRQDYISVVQQLLSADAISTVVNSDMLTPAMLAAEAGNVECLHLLLLYNSDCTARNRNSQTVLHLAAVNGTADMVDVVLEANQHIMNWTDLMGNSALIASVKLGHTQFALQLLKYSPNLSLIGDQERNALHWAAENGLVQVVSRIGEQLQKDPELFAKVANVQDCLGNTSVVLATQNKHDDCVQVLLQIGCDTAIKGQYGRNLLHWLAIHGCSAQTRQLIFTRKTEVNALDDESNSALVLAAANRNYEMLSDLLDHFDDCDVNIQGTEGRTALHWLALRGNLTMLQRILNTGRCSLDLQDGEGKTALLISAENSRVQCFTELIQKGAQLNVTGNYRTSVLHYVCEAGLQYCVELALQAGARVNLQEEQGHRTALTIAAREGHVKVMRMLIDAQCDVTLPELDGKTALWYMARQGEIEMVCLLLISLWILFVEVDDFCTTIQTTLFQLRVPYLRWMAGLFAPTGLLVMPAGIAVCHWLVTLSHNAAVVPRPGQHPTPPPHTLTA